MLEIFIISTGAAIYIMGAALSTLLEAELKIIVLSFSIAAFLISIITAAYADYKKRKYICNKCGHKFNPTFSKYIISPHFGRTRHLKCPYCGEKSWCKACTDKD